MEKEQNKQLVSFEEIFAQNKRRIHYQIHKMNISDPHQDFFQEGLCALWNAYETYNPDKGPMATYFNFAIRNRLIDKIRKETRTVEKEQTVVEAKKTQLDDGNHKKQNETPQLLPDRSGVELNDNQLWKALQKNLTEKQWKWIKLYIIEEIPLKEIARMENTTTEAVKSWGKQTRSKLRSKEFREKIGLEIDI